VGESADVAVAGGPANLCDEEDAKGDVAIVVVDGGGNGRKAVAVAVAVAVGGALAVAVAVGTVVAAGAVGAAGAELVFISLSLPLRRLLKRSGGRRRRASEITRSVRARMRFWMCT
jgi:hypothetical protein